LWVISLCFFISHENTHSLLLRGFLEESYNDEHFVKFISNFLSPEGIFVAYVGEISEVNSPSEEYSYFKYRHRLMENLSKCFESVRDFEEVSALSPTHTRIENGRTKSTHHFKFS
jgi:hypothetical protein